MVLESAVLFVQFHTNIKSTVHNNATVAKYELVLFLYPATVVNRNNTTI